MGSYILVAVPKEPRLSNKAVEKMSDLTLGLGNIMVGSIIFTICVLQVRCKIYIIRFRCSNTFLDDKYLAGQQITMSDMFTFYLAMSILALGFVILLLPTLVHGPKKKGRK